MKLGGLTLKFGDLEIENVWKKVVVVGRWDGKWGFSNLVVGRLGVRRGGARQNMNLSKCGKQLGNLRNIQVFKRCQSEMLTLWCYLGMY